MPKNLDVESMFYLSGRPTYRHQPGIFFTRRIYDRAGGVNPAWHYCMDYDLHLRMVAIGAKVAYSDVTVARYRRHQAVKTAGRAGDVLRAANEYIKISNRVAPEVGLLPNHVAAHVRTLCGAAVKGFQCGQISDAMGC